MSVLALAALKIFRHGKAVNKNDRYGMVDDRYILLTSLFSITGGICIAAGVVNGLDPVNWISLLDPRAGLAWRVLQNLNP